MLIGTSFPVGALLSAKAKLPSFNGADVIICHGDTGTINDISMQIREEFARLAHGATPQRHQEPKS